MRLGDGRDECHSGMAGVEMIFAHRPSPTGRNEFTREQHSILFQSGYGGIRAHQTQTQRRRYLRARCLPVLLHETGDSCLGIHDLIKSPKKV